MTSDLRLVRTLSKTPLSAYWQVIERARFLLAGLVLINGLCLLSLRAVGADTVAWGEADHGLRLGMAFTELSGQRAVRIVLRNSLKQEQHVYIGNGSGSGLMSDVQFLAKDSSGKERHSAERNSFKPGTGIISPIIVRMASGAEEHWIYPFTEVFCCDCSNGLSFADLIREHATLQLHFEVSAQRAQAAEPAFSQLGLRSAAELWTGNLLSGELRP